MHSDRREARDLVRQQAPDFIIGSPPCTAFCAWNVHMNSRKMKPEKVKAVLKEGRMHLEFMASLYRLQIQMAASLSMNIRPPLFHGMNDALSNCSLSRTCIW